MKEDEQNLLFLLKRGDSTAYKYIYDYHYVLLCSVAYEYLKDEFLAETIVEDIIFHLWEKRETFEITISLRSYLVRAVRNRCINYLSLERERKEVTFSSMNVDDTAQLSASPAFDYPLATLLEKELEQQITQAIEKLPDDCRRVFKMSRFDGKSYEQISQALSISVNTVKYHMKNALSRLNKDLSEYLICLFFYFICR